jgi:hypothetical protein
MFPCQDDPDPDEEANYKTDDETKPGSVMHRAFAQIENSRRLIFVHRVKSAPLTGVRKAAEALALSTSIGRHCFRVDDISNWSD